MDPLINNQPDCYNPFSLPSNIKSFSQNNKIDSAIDQIKLISEKQGESIMSLEKDTINQQEHSIVGVIFSKNIKTKEVPQIYIYAEVDSAVDMHKKTEGFYQCTKKEKDFLSDGFFYTFTAKQEYKVLDLKEREAVLDQHYNTYFPAIQQFPDFLEIPVSLSFLGYKVSKEDNVFSLRLPDEKAIMGRWRKMYSDESTIINVVSQDGIADDTFFIRSFIDGKMVLSMDKEFLHDHIVHLVGQLSGIIKSFEIDKKNGNTFGTAYLTSISNVRNKAYEVQLRIDKLEEELKDTDKTIVAKVLRTLLAILIDTFSVDWSEDSEKNFMESLKPHISETIIDDRDWGSYLIKHYGQDIVDNYEKITKSWDSIIISLK